MHVLTYWERCLQEDANRTASAKEGSAQLANGHASANGHTGLGDEQSSSSQDPSSRDYSGSCTLRQAVQQVFSQLPNTMQRRPNC